MFDLLVTGTAALLYYSGMVSLGLWLAQRRARKLIILCYHHADGKNLRRHLLYLKRHYRIVPLEAALAELYNPGYVGTRQSDRRLPLVITFDDGYYDNYTHAFEFARTLNIPITIFLVPTYIGSTKYFWWQEGNHLSTHTLLQQVTLEGRCYNLDNMAGRKAVAQAIDHYVFHAPSVTAREAYLVTARRALSVQEQEHALAGKNSSSLTWEHIQAMERSGWVSFGGHTMNHPVLACLNDPVEVEYEISACHTVLEQHLGHPVHAFAYPIGKLEHIGKLGPMNVQTAGFDWAVTTLEGFNTACTSPYLLRRFVLDGQQSWLLLAAKTSGAWKFLTSPYQLFVSLFRNFSGNHA